MIAPIPATPANCVRTAGANPTAAKEARMPELTPNIPRIFPCRAVACEARPESEPMHKRLLARYPACTRPAIPVLAAAMYPAPKSVAGIPYSQGYSGGSVGPTLVRIMKGGQGGDIRLNISSMRFVITNPPETFTNASKTDNAPSTCGNVWGIRPPPMMKKPPTPTMPENRQQRKTTTG
jgi:hypothetical protein